MSTNIARLIQAAFDSADIAPSDTPISIFEEGYRAALASAPAQPVALLAARADEELLRAEHYKKRALKAEAALASAPAQPCGMGEICLGCEPRRADGSCPDGPAQPVEMTDDDLPTLLENEIVRTVSLDILHQRAATEIRQLRAALYSQPVAMTDEQIVDLGRSPKSNLAPWGIGSTRADYIRGVRAALSAQAATKVPSGQHCPHCGTHEIELLRRCHNSSCGAYAKDESIYEGWTSPEAKAQAVAGDADLKRWIDEKARTTMLSREELTHAVEKLNQTAPQPVAMTGEQDIVDTARVFATNVEYSNNRPASIQFTREAVVRFAHALLGDLSTQAAPKVQDSEPPCPCKERPASKCEEPWGPKCDLGNNPKYARRSPSPEAKAQAVPEDTSRAVLIAGSAQQFAEDRTHLGNLVYVNDLVWALKVLAAATQPPAPSEQRKPLTQAARDVLSERQRQISIEGWTPEHDDEHDHGELAAAAASYADPQATPPALGGACYIPLLWPRQWDTSWWRPRDKRRNLVKAGALILAEIERLDRAALRSTGGDQSCES